VLHRPVRRTRPSSNKSVLPTGPRFADPLERNRNVREISRTWSLSKESFASAPIRAGVSIQNRDIFLDHQYMPPLLPEFVVGETVTPQVSRDYARRKGLVA
jgi:hypothetical protein